MAFALRTEEDRDSMDSDRPSTIVQHQSLPERVHQILRERILTKELPAGTLLIELDLSEEFGVSRTTIRSALRELKAERLI